MLNDQQMRDLLAATRRIAIVGASDKAGRPADRVGRYLLAHGYEVIPVHPVRATVWDLPAVPSLAALPEPVEIVNLFRAPQYCPGHAREVLALPWRPRLFWMQQGIRSEEAARLLEDAGVPVVQDACLMLEHARLAPVEEC